MKAEMSYSDLIDRIRELEAKNKELQEAYDAAIIIVRALKKRA